MNLFETILGNQGSGLVDQLAKQAGLNQSEVQNIVGQLIPALSNGIKSNAASGSNGLEGLLNALQSGNHEKYVDKPEILGEADTREEGNAILGHILGSKDESRNLARQTSQLTGADESIIKKLLPLVATTVMGALSKQTGGAASMASQLGGGNSDLSNLVTSFLDTNKDGNVSDDLLNIAKKFF